MSSKKQWIGSISAIICQSISNSAGIFFITSLPHPFSIYPSSLEALWKPIILKKILCRHSTLISSILFPDEESQTWACLQQFSLALHFWFWVKTAWVWGLRKHGYTSETEVCEIIVWGQWILTGGKSDMLIFVGSASIADKWLLKGFVVHWCPCC